MKFIKFYKRHEARLSKPFEKYGVFVAKYPWQILYCCIAFNCLMGLGLIRLDTESDAEKLYTPENGQAKRDRDIVDSLFPDMSGRNFYSKDLNYRPHYGEIIFQTKDGSNILTQTVIEEIDRVHGFINSTVRITDRGSSIGLEDVCAIRNGRCAIAGDFIFSPGFRTAIEANNITYPFFETAYMEGIFGDIQTSRGLLTSAKMVKLSYFLRQDTPHIKKLSREWEDKFVQVLHTFSSRVVKIAYSSSRSLDQELEKNIAGDTYVFVLAISLMLIYAMFATTGGDCVSDRQNLGRAGVLATIIALVGSLGLVSATGVKFVAIAWAVPFLIIGIGLDDMFILLSCLADASKKTSVEDRIKETMRTGGIAITITSLTDLVSFAVGASAPFLSVRNFCIYTGVAVLFTYINQLAFFVPCIVINERRVEGSRHCGTCRRIKSRRELRTEGKSLPFVFCCGGEAPKRRTDNESIVETFLKRIFRIPLALVPAQVAIIALFLVYLAWSIYGIVRMEQGLFFSDLVREDSYYYEFSILLENYFPWKDIIGFIIPSSLDYRDATIQESITDLMSKARADVDINSNVYFDWLSDYRNSYLYNDTSELGFVKGLKTFLTIRTDHANDVVFNTAETQIIACRFHVLVRNILSESGKSEMVIRLREIASNSPLNVFCYSVYFIFIESTTATLKTTFLTVGVAVGAVFLLALIFMPHPFLLVCVTGTMAMICSGVIGFMYHWDLNLSAITMIEIIMSIGFSVDFSIHICHAFLTVNGATKKERVDKALDRAGGATINAALSSVVGVIVLLFSKSFLFMSFFKMMVLVMMFGLAHALLLLPVVLLLLGPVSNEHEVSPEVTDGRVISPRISYNIEVISVDENDAINLD